MRVSHWISRNGIIIEPHRACVHVQNPVVTSALGVYETLQVVNGRIFRLHDHLMRLERSAQAIDLMLPASLVEIARWAKHLIQEARAQEATIRVLAVNSDPFLGPTVYMMLLPPVHHPRELYEYGASAVTFEGERPLPTAKTVNTLVNFLARRKAQAQGAHEGLLVARDGIREGATSNIFAVIKGALVTPPDHLAIAGVTRDIVIRLAQARGYRLIFRPLPVSSIPHWEEAFLTSTSRHVMPLTRVDGMPINGGDVGPVTRGLMQAFEKVFRKEVFGETDVEY